MSRCSCCCLPWTINDDDDKKSHALTWWCPVIRLINKRLQNKQ